MLATDVRSLHVSGSRALALTHAGRLLSCSWPDMRVQQVLDGQGLTLLASLADGRWLTGAESGEVTLYSAADEPLQRLRGADEPVFRLFGDLPGDRLLVVPNQGPVTCWRDGALEHTLAQTDVSASFAVLQDGTLAVLRHFNDSCRLQLYPPPTYALQATLDLDKPFRAVTAHRQLVLSCSNDVDDEEVRVLSYPGLTPVHSFQAYGLHVAFSPDGRFWVNAEYLSVRLFDGHTFQLLATLPLATSWSPLHFAFADHHLVVAQAEQVVQVWDLDELGYENAGPGMTSP